MFSCSRNRCSLPRGWWGMTGHPPATENTTQRTTQPRSALLADAAERLRSAPGDPERGITFPRRRGRPRTRPENGHVSGQAVEGDAQPSDAAQQNGHADRAGVSRTPATPPERPIIALAPALLSVPDAGAYLGGLSVRTVEGYITAGLLTPVRLPSPRGGGRLARVLLDRAELDRFVEQARRERS
jgi:hypothetical protein